MLIPIFSKQCHYIEGWELVFMWLLFFDWCLFFFLNKLHCPREMFLQIQFAGKYSFKDTWLAGPPTKRFGELCPPREAWSLHVTMSLSVASALTGVRQPPVSTSTFRLRQVPGTLRAANLPNVVKNARLSQVSESNTATSWLKTNKQLWGTAVIGDLAAAMS